MQCLVASASNVEARLRSRFGRHDAEDAAQEAVVKALVALRNGCVLEHPDRWAMTAALRAAIDANRRSRQLAPLGAQDFPDHREDDVARLEREEAGRNLLAGLNAAIDRIPGEAGEVARLHWKDGLKQREVRDRLGLSDGRVTRLLAEAREFLRLAGHAPRESC